MHADSDVPLPDLPLARDELLSSAEDVLEAACDAFHVGPPPVAVLRPRTVDALCRAVPRLADAGLAIVPRGAALSYSAGAIGRSRPWVAVDLRRLDRVEAVDVADGRVRVQAGCTWAQLRAALAPHGLRTPFWGPASGLHATIGGTVANDGIFFGSARHGTAADTVLGLTVLLADGRVLRTGVDAVAGDAVAVPFGPDATRLFVGSCGALGLIVGATLRAARMPVATGCASFRCPSRDVALACLEEAVAYGDSTEALLLDPAVTTLLDGSVPAETTVPGRVWHPAAPYLLAFATDAPSDQEAALRLARLASACTRHGARADGEGPLRAFHQTPFAAPTMVHLAGRRWVPVHGIVPPTRVGAALDAMDDAMRACTGPVASLGLRWTTTCAAVGAGAVLVEANLTWPDGGNALLERYLGGDARPAEYPDRWRQVARVRSTLADALASCGASHLQIGRFYTFRSRMDPTMRSLLDVLKDALDPSHALNPGVLGLPGGVGE